MYSVIEKDEYALKLLYYVLADDTRPYLLIGNYNNILVEILDGSQSISSSNIYNREMRNIVALDFDSLGNRIYWSDSRTNKIYSAYSNGTDTKVVRE